MQGRRKLVSAKWLWASVLSEWWVLQRLLKRLHRIKGGVCAEPWSLRGRERPLQPEEIAGKGEWGRSVQVWSKPWGADSWGWSRHVWKDVVEVSQEGKLQLDHEWPQRPLSFPFVLFVREKGEEEKCIVGWFPPFTSPKTPHICVQCQNLRLTKVFL